MIKLLSRLKDSKESEEINADALIEDVTDTEASKVSGGGSCWWWWCWG